METDWVNRTYTQYNMKKAEGLKSTAKLCVVCWWLLLRKLGWAKQVEGGRTYGNTGKKRKEEDTGKKREEEKEL